MKIIAFVAAASLLAAATARPEEISGLSEDASGTLVYSTPVVYQAPVIYQAPVAYLAPVFYVSQFMAQMVDCNPCVQACQAPCAPPQPVVSITYIGGGQPPRQNSAPVCQPETQVIYFGHGQAAQQGYQFSRAR